MSFVVTDAGEVAWRPNFRPLDTSHGFSVDGYALGVCNELRQALEGLVEK